MTIAALIERYRPHLDDGSVGIRRSWEEVFRYTLKVYDGDTRVEDFDLAILADRLAAAGLHSPLVDGYVERWRQLLKLAAQL